MKTYTKSLFLLFCLVISGLAACKKDGGDSPTFAVINIGKDSVYAGQEVKYNIVYNSTSKLKNLKIEETFEGGSGTRTVRDSAINGSYNHDFVTAYKVPDTLSTQRKIILKFTVTRDDNSTSTTERTVIAKNGQVTLSINADKTAAAAGGEVNFAIQSQSPVALKRLIIKDMDSASAVSTSLKDTSINTDNLNYNFRYMVPSGAQPGSKRIITFTTINFIDLSAIETRTIAVTN